MNHIHRKLLPIILYVMFNLFFCLSSLLAANGSQVTATVSMPAFTGAQSSLVGSPFDQKPPMFGMANMDGFYKGVFRRGIYTFVTGQYRQSRCALSFLVRIQSEE